MGWFSPVEVPHHQLLLHMLYHCVMVMWYEYSLHDENKLLCYRLTHNYCTSLRPWINPACECLKLTPPLNSSHVVTWMTQIACLAVCTHALYFHALYFTVRTVVIVLYKDVSHVYFDDARRTRLKLIKPALVLFLYSEINSTRRKWSRKYGIWNV